VRGSAEPGPRKLRLFFALWPDDAMRGVLAGAVAPAVAQVDGQPVPAANFHVTLAFLGAVPGQTFAQLVEAGGRDRHARVELAFDHVEYWVKPKVLVAMPSRVPAAAVSIVDRLWSRMAPLGHERELRPWRPHLTLVRRVRRRPPEDLRLAPALAGRRSDAGWKLALVESVTHAEGPRYKPLAEWPLAGN
jgi:RNA 2',3'-cyclic 3'-phosphodiesterase